MQAARVAVGATASVLGFKANEPENPSTVLNPSTALNESADLGAAGLKQHEVQLYQANGCALCTDGYKGRIGIYEVLVMNNQLAELMLSDASNSALAAAVSASGMLTLRQAALAKVRQGMISLAEANRITQDA